MAKSVLLKANPRTAKGGGPVRRLRAAGRVPAVLYGKRTTAADLELSARELDRLFHHGAGENILVDLEVDASGKIEKRLALVQDVQHDPVSGRILHIDLHEIAADEKLKTHIPVDPTGEPVGVKTHGGLLEHILRELHVECLPKDLPDRVVVDVSALNIGESIHVADIAVPDGVTVLNSRDLVVFAVAAPVTAEPEPAAAAAAAATQPEVITEKKPAEGAAAAEAPEGKKEKK